MALMGWLKVHPRCDNADPSLRMKPGQQHTALFQRDHARHKFAA